MMLQEVRGPVEHQQVMRWPWYLVSSPKCGVAKPSWRGTPSRREVRHIPFGAVEPRITAQQPVNWSGDAGQLRALSAQHHHLAVLGQACHRPGRVLPPACRATEADADVGFGTVAITFEGRAVVSDRGSAGFLRSKATRRPLVA